MFNIRSKYFSICNNKPSTSHPYNKEFLSVLNSVGLVPSWASRASYHCATVPSWVRNFFSWVFRVSKVFSREYFVGLKHFLVGISWVQIFSRRYFIGTSRIYKWGMRNKCRTPAPTNKEQVYLKIIFSNFSTHKPSRNISCWRREET